MAEIRSLTPSDYPAVSALSEFALKRALVGRPVWETAGDVAADLAAVQDGEFIVAVEPEGAILGMAGFALDPGGEAQVYGPLVAEEGNGIGAWLESRIVSLAVQKGAESLSMLIGLNNREGIAWAEWRGYLRDTEYPETLLTFVYPGELNSRPLPDSAVVRRASAKDLDPIYAIYQDSFLYAPLTREAWGARLDGCQVVEVSGEVAGFLHFDEASRSIDHLCIRPGLRRQGLGAGLLSTVLLEFWQRQPIRVGLSVPMDSAGLVTLFRRLGFRREVPLGRWVKRTS
jgi:GNAT superfamily N-acetyltransferase